MKKTMFLAPLMILLPVCAFAVDGVVLINQSTVLAAGGFPYKITQPGSYKLSGNLVVTSVNTDGIDINAVNVSLDLGGFSITGPAACGNTQECAAFSANGISGAPGGFKVYNGFVKGFVNGVVLNGEGLLMDLSSTQNGINGFSLNLNNVPGAMIVHCISSNNGGSGFSGGSIYDSEATFNFLDGVTFAFKLMNSNLFGNGRYALGSAYLFGNNVLFSNPTNFGPSPGISQHNNTCQNGNVGLFSC